MKKEFPVTCNKDCGAGCPLIAHVEDGRLIRITNSRRMPQKASGCPVGYGFPKVVYAKERLTRPLLRTGPRGSGRFRELSWEEALDLTAQKLTEIKDKHGTESMIHLGGSGSCRGALHHTGRLTARFLGLWGEFTETIGSYSSQAVTFATPYVLGTTMAGMDAATLHDSKLIVLWGANISDTRFGNETEKRIAEIKKSGVPVVVIDPRRSRTVSKLATEWIRVYPGTDTALMAAMIHVLLEEDRIDRDFVEKCTVGLPELEAYINGDTDGTPKTPEWAEGICGTPAETIQSLARRWAEATPTALIPGLSIQRTIGGEEASRFAVVLQALTGNIGKKGGTSGSCAWNRLPKPRCPKIQPVRENKLSVQVYGFADAILGGKSGGYPSDIKAIYNVGGNYLSQGSDIKKNIEAFSNVEFSVCHDFFMTPTARYCDMVLPTATWIEREDIVFPDNNYLMFSHRAIEPWKGVKDDYGIFCELSQRLGFLPEFSENRTARQWLDHFMENSDVKDKAQFMETGVFDGKHHERTPFSDFVEDPGKHPLNTPSGLIELSSAKYAETGFPPYPTCRILPVTEDCPLRLVSPHPRYRIHSQTANMRWFKDKERQVLWINPGDAEKRGIEDGKTIAVFNEIGCIHIEVFVTDGIMEGVVCLLEGGWPKITDNIETAGAVNMLTSTDPTKPSEGARTHSVLVEVEPLD